ncbi:hypothetical protein ROZALSC1DRAFT_29122 [Rozella allomycis CSF55]|uniref:Condensation domain-containing protein n=1 Tax=Rozella allomycis (strain CSF55) TaxID=988480 RepID=A0A4P9YIT2_ROZAC|nr:hypothetical protein ROZALSC1DRAFT_29122 [Rozella allomycis CSF55]
MQKSSIKEIILLRHQESIHETENALNNSKVADRFYVRNPTPTLPSIKRNFHTSNLQRSKDTRLSNSRPSNTSFSVPELSKAPKIDRIDEWIELNKPPEILQPAKEKASVTKKKTEKSQRLPSAASVASNISRGSSKAFNKSRLNTPAIKSQAPSRSETSMSFQINTISKPIVKRQTPVPQEVSKPKEKEYSRVERIEEESVIDSSLELSNAEVKPEGQVVHDSILELTETLPIIEYLNEEEEPGPYLKYPLSVFQQYFFAKQKSLEDFSKFYVHQGHVLNTKSVNIEKIEKICQVIVLCIPILRTEFSNVSVDDVDVQPQVVKSTIFEKVVRTTLWRDELPVELDEFKNIVQQVVEFDEEKSTSRDELNETFVTAEMFYKKTDKFVCKSNPSIELFKVFVYPIDDQANCEKYLMSVVLSSLIADQRSCSWLSQTIVGLVEHFRDKEEPSFHDLINEIKSRIGNGGTALEYFKDEESKVKPLSVAIAFWRSVLVDSLKDNIADLAYVKISLKNLEKKFDNLKHLRDAAQKRMNQLQHSLKECIEQRKKFDIFTMDLISEEEIDDKYRIELMKVMLKEEYGNENLIDVLIGQGISRDVIAILRLNEDSLLAFSQIKEENLTVKMLTKEKKKLLAIAAFLRNRFRICLEEQSRIKFEVERKISKLKRELSKISDSYSKLQHDLEITEDTIIKYNNLMNPPLLDFEIPEARFDYTGNMANNFRNLNSDWSLTDLTTSIRKTHEWLSFPIRHKIGSEIRRFVKDWFIVKGIQDKHKDSTKKSMEDIFINSGEQVNLFETCLINSFGILIRHIIGNEKFLIGVEKRSPPTATLVGPFTSVIPVKIDFSDRDITFHESFSEIFSQLKRGSFHHFYPLDVLRKELAMNLDLNIRFSYVSPSDCEVWKLQGKSPEEMISVLSASHVWTFDSSNDYDMKLTIFDNIENLTAILQYRKDVISDKDVSRWVDKFLSILESIESSHKKLKVTSVVSRFYHTAFTSHPDLKSIRGSSTNLKISK